MKLLRELGKLAMCVVMAMEGVLIYLPNVRAPRGWYSVGWHTLAVSVGALPLGALASFGLRKLARKPVVQWIMAGVVLVGGGAAGAAIAIGIDWWFVNTAVGRQVHGGLPPVLAHAGCRPMLLLASYLVIATALALLGRKPVLPITRASVALMLGLAVVEFLTIGYPLSGAPGREAARTWKCLRNLKSIGRALLMYAADHDSRLPPAACAEELIGFDEAAVAELLRCPDSDCLKPKGPLAGYVENCSAFVCPSDPLFVLMRRGKPAGEAPRLSYWWNPQVSGCVIDNLPEWTIVLRDRSNWHFRGYCGVDRTGQTRFFSWRPQRR